MPGNYDSATTYDSTETYDGSGGSSTGGTWKDIPGVLNQLATTANWDAAGAANQWAGTKNNELIGALNIKAGTTNLSLNDVCNVLLRATYSQYTTTFDAQGALNILAGNTPGP